MFSPLILDFVYIIIYNVKQAAICQQKEHNLWIFQK